MPVPLAAGVTARVAEVAAGLGEAAAAVRPLGPWAGVLLCAAGAAALTVATRSRRALAVLGGAAAGALGALALRGWLAAHLGLSPEVGAVFGAAAGAAAGGLSPGVFPFAAGALPGALLGAGVPLAGRAFLGAGAGALLGGLVGLAAGRAVGAVFASAIGGALVAVGGVTLLGARPIAADLAARPWALVGVAVVAAIAGAAYQLSLADRPPAAGQAPLGPPEERRDVP